MRILRPVYEWSVFVVALAVLACVQLGWAVLASILWRCVSPARGRTIGRRVIAAVFRSLFVVTGWLNVLKVDASALDAIDPSESMIIASNHPSVLDALILISRMDDLNCIMKASVLDNVLLGSGARLAGYIRNDGPRRMMRLASAELKRGGQLIVFPEGTRTLSAPVNAFKGGFASIARRAGVPVQTVIVETDTPFLSKGWSVLRKPPRLPMTFKVRIGERFHVGNDTSAFVQSLHAYYVRELEGAQLGDLWDRSHGADAMVDPFVVSPAAVEDEGDDEERMVDGAPPAWRPAPSHSATHPW